MVLGIPDRLAISNTSIVSMNPFSITCLSLYPQMLHNHDDILGWTPAASSGVSNDLGPSHGYLED